MAKNILSSKQLAFLGALSKNKDISKRFYLTGGTALSGFYLQHRVSEDIDFFIEKEDVNDESIDAFLHDASSQLSIENVKKTYFSDFISYQLVYKDKQQLTVDFRRYPYTPLYKGTEFRNIQIDSVYDIAISKIQSLLKRIKSRDFIDLFFIMQSYNYSLEQIIMDSKIKFFRPVDKITLATQFAKVKELPTFPTMLVPLEKKKMEDFFILLSHDLSERVFR